MLQKCLKINPDSVNAQERLDIYSGRVHQTQITQDAVAQARMTVEDDSQASQTETTKAGSISELLTAAQRDLLDSAAIAHGAGNGGFVLLGGGGPKNFVQQTGPVLKHILGVDFEGAERGLQIGAAVERDGSLSSCTFSESVTWGKYCSADAKRLVQVWGEYSMVFPVITAYVLDRCTPRPHSNLSTRIPALVADLRGACDWTP